MNSDDMHSNNVTNILIVDDNHKNIVSMKSVLSELDVNLFIAESGEEALQLLLRHSFAVVFLDVQMPDMDGYEVAEVMSNNSASASTPIVFVTAIYNDNKNVKAGYDVGAIDYMSKPLDPHILLAKAKIFIKLDKQQRQLKELVVQLDELANTDTLTGLANRYQFNYTFEKLLETNKRHERQFALVLVDLDNFKLINDNYGHDVGDDLLKQVSGRLVESLRKSDHIARLGGDEFAVLLSELKSAEEVGNIISLLIDKMTEDFHIGNRQLSVTISIGVATYPSASDTIVGLFKAADIALYRAKSKGKNTFEYYTDTLNEKYQRRALVEREFQSAIEHNEFYLVYQPRFNMDTNQIIGVEALARWKCKALGDVSPVEFIAIAEEIGFIDKLGSYLIHSAFQQFVKWQSIHPDITFSLAINLSPYQILNQSFVNNIKKIKSQYPIDMECIEFEITESAFKGYDTELEIALDTIRNLGISFSIDDFGTGYSSLTRLKLLPIKILKIDQSFVSGVTMDKDDAAIVQAIIALAKALSLDVIAEGVETEEQKEFLLGNGCQIAQGYYYSKPVSHDKITQLLGEQKEQPNEQ